jgi:8-oxo-dGTP diphosphatase
MPQIRVTCEAYIVRDGQLLLGKRGKKAFGAGDWALPGGHMEFSERADECVIRELKEETGMRVTPADVELIAVTDHVKHNPGTHIVHLSFKVNIGTQEPQLLEPDRCQEWRWFRLNDLPVPIMNSHADILKTIASTKVYLS